jgi:hypothetical protein
MTSGYPAIVGVPRPAHMALAEWSLAHSVTDRWVGQS